MEVEVLRERTKDGLDAARAREKNGGRIKGDYDKKKSTTAALLYKEGKYSIAEILYQMYIKMVGRTFCLLQLVNAGTES